MNKFLPLILIVCATIYFYPITSLAQKFDPDSEEGKAFNNESSEFVTCSSFYGVLNEAAKRSESEDAAELAVKSVHFSEEAFDYALLYAETTRSEELAMKVTLARLKLEIDDMKKEIEGDFSNTPILMAKYLEPCKEKMEHPTAVLEKWQ